MHSKRNGGKIKRNESPKEIRERVIIMRAKGPRRPNRMKIGAMEIAHIFGRRGAVDIAMNIVLQDLTKQKSFKHLFCYGPRHRKCCCNLEGAPNLKDICEEDLDAGLNRDGETDVKQT